MHVTGVTRGDTGVTAPSVTWLGMATGWWKWWKECLCVPESQKCWILPVCTMPYCQIYGSAGKKGFWFRFKVVWKIWLWDLLMSVGKHPSPGENSLQLKWCLCHLVYQNKCIIKLSARYALLSSYLPQEERRNEAFPQWTKILISNFSCLVVLLLQILLLLSFCSDCRESQELQLL